VSGYTPVCRIEQVPVERGVPALVDGEQVALFRTADDVIHALGNCDPFSGAMVLARGIVGSRGETATVASPMYKQVFDLASGGCLDDPDVSVPAYPVRVRNGYVEVSLVQASAPARRPA
jgi:nitrite reductase (NADH) small subunit